MKKNLLVIGIGFLFVGASIFSACTKEGPMGPAGANGTNGINGTNGTNGVDGKDGASTCTECHDNSQAINSMELQWATSGHAVNGNYGRNTTDCAPCHTSQGFLERMAAGTMVTAATINNPMPPNCYTCHQIHSTYTETDLSLTYTAPVAFWHNPSGEATPDYGKGNLCANCHQARVTTPFPAVGSTETFAITSYRYGPHHGPMAQVLGGFGGYEVSGTLSYSNSPHTGVTDACVTCHLGTYNPTSKIGGHNMSVNIASNCVTCHPDGIATETEAMQVEIKALLEELHDKLVANGVATDAGYLAGDNGGNASTTNPANLSANELGAFFNFKLIEEDKSAGVHNYKYTKALLTNSIGVLAKK